MSISLGCCAKSIYQGQIQVITFHRYTVYPKKYAHGFCFAVLCCGYTLTDFHISIRLTSLALWQSDDCPSASKATLMNMDKYFIWIHYEWLHNHNKAKHNTTVCLFLGIYCTVGCNHMSLSLLPVSGTTLLICHTFFVSSHTAISSASTAKLIIMVRLAT